MFYPASAGMYSLDWPTNNLGCLPIFKQLILVISKGSAHLFMENSIVIVFDCMVLMRQ
jgi:hypothetical protein